MPSLVRKQQCTLLRKLSGVGSPGCGCVTHLHETQTHRLKLLNTGSKQKPRCAFLVFFFCIQQLTHLEVVEELEAAGGRSCPLNGLSQRQGTLAPFCPVSALHGIKSAMFFGEAADEVQLSLRICPVKAELHVKALRMGERTEFVMFLP